MIEDLLPRCWFPPPGTDVTCAVSGGPDSLALLVLATAADCRVTAVHVDHGIRPNGEAEAALVSAAAQRFGARFRSEQVRVPPGPNLEARLRSARYAVLPSDVLTGHTADDQAETVLLNLLRGSGRSGLAAMRPEGHPLLSLRRSETHALCDSLGLEPVIDPSNDDPRIRRNRVRHELLPLADDIAQRDVGALLARTASLLHDDETFLEHLSLDIDPTDARALSSTARPLAVRALRRWLAPHLGGYAPDHDAIERVLDVARGSSTSCDVCNGVRVHRRLQRLSIVRLGSAEQGDPTPHPTR